MAGTTRLWPFCFYNFSSGPLGSVWGLSLWADEAQLLARLGISQLLLLVTQPGLGLLGSQDEMDHLLACSYRSSPIS